MAAYQVELSLANLEGGGEGVAVLEIHPEWAPLGAK